MHFIYFFMYIAPFIVYEPNFSSVINSTFLLRYARTIFCIWFLVPDVHVMSQMIQIKEAGTVRKRLLTWQNVTYKRAVENFSLPPAGSSFQGSLFPHELLSSDNAEFALFDVIQNSGVQSPPDSSGWSQGSKKSLPSTCAGNLTSPPGTRCSPGALS